MSRRRPKRPAAAAFLVLLAAVWGVLIATGDATIARAVEPPAASPADEPLLPGLPNFHRVDDHLFRGGQPAAGGIARLKSLGVRTIVDLRYERGLLKKEETEARAAGLDFFSVPMYGLVRPTDDQVARVLALLDDPSHWPVFIHCKRGSDRAGTIVACYRIAHAGWTAKMAIREALDYGMMWLEFAKRSFIRDFYTKTQALGRERAVATAGPSPSSIPSPPTRSAPPPTSLPPPPARSAPLPTPLPPPPAGSATSPPPGSDQAGANRISRPIPR